MLTTTLALAALALSCRTDTLEVPAGTLQESPGASPEPQAPAEAPKVFQPGPGLIPPGTAPEALALWQAMLAATRPLGTNTDGIRSFDVLFEVLQRSESSVERSAGSVDGTTRVRFLAPTYVSLSIEEGERKETGYGPGGFYLAGEEGVYKMRSRDYKQDRELVQRTLSMAKNFASLADLSKLTLYELEACPHGITERKTALAGEPGTCGHCPPGPLPKTRLGAGYHKLDWLVLLTPDFQLAEDLSGIQRDAAADPARDVYRVRMGLDPETHRPRCLHIEKEPIAGRRTPPEQFVVIDDVVRRDGWILPKGMLMWERLRTAVEARFREFAVQPDREAWLLLEKTRVNPPLQPDDFDPFEDER